MRPLFYRIEEIALMQLNKATAVKNTTGFVYEITFSASKDMRPAIFDFAHDKGLKILQLVKKNRSLEQLFQQLTSN